MWNMVKHQYLKQLMCVMHGTPVSKIVKKICVLYNVKIFHISNKHKRLTYQDSVYMLTYVNTAVYIFG